MADAGDLDEAILIADSNLGLGAGFGASWADAGDFGSDGFVVCGREVGGHAEAAADAATGHVAGHDGEEILPHARDAFIDLCFSTGAHADADDDGGDTDDDAEHGEEGTKDVPAQGAQGDF